MTLKGIKHQKMGHHYHHKGPPFDIKHQLISADLLSVVKMTKDDQTSFQYFFLQFLQSLRSVLRTFFFIEFGFHIKYFKGFEP